MCGLRLEPEHLLIVLWVVWKELTQVGRWCDKYGPRPNWKWSRCKTWLSDTRVICNSVVDHRSSSSVLSTVYLSHLYRYVMSDHTGHWETHAIQVGGQRHQRTQATFEKVIFINKTLFKSDICCFRCMIWPLLHFVLNWKSFYINICRFINKTEQQVLRYDTVFANTRGGEGG